MECVTSAVWLVCYLDCTSSSWLTCQAWVKFQWPGFRRKAPPYSVTGAWMVSKVHWLFANCHPYTTWEAQEGLADFGICLITVESAGNQMGDGWVASSDKTALAGWALELATEWSVGAGVWDPKHGSCWFFPLGCELAGLPNIRCMSR